MSRIDSLLKTNIKFVPAVVCFPVKDGKVLLIHRLKTSDGLGQNLVSGAGGKVGDKILGETEEQAVVREMQEEVHITPKNFRNAGTVKFLWVNKPKWNMHVSIYIIDSWEGLPEETEVAKPVWHEISKLPEQNMWEDNIHWVPKVLAGEKLEAVFLYGENGSLEEYRFY